VLRDLHMAANAAKGLDLSDIMAMMGVVRGVSGGWLEASRDMFLGVLQKPVLL
jgi:hypothetical protein